MTNPYDDLLDAAPQSPAPALVPPPAAPVAAPRPMRGQPAANPYLDLIPEADNTGKAALTVGLSSDRNASAAATDMALAKKYKTTPQVVAAFPEDFRQRAQMELARDALAKAPALSKAIVNNPALAAAVHPEVPKLSLVNQAIDALGQTARYVTGAGNGRSAATDMLAIGSAASRAVSPLFEKVFMAAGGLASLADSTDKYGARTPNIVSDAAFKAVDFFKETGKYGAPGADAGLWDKALDMAGQTGGIVMEALATGGEAPVARAGAGLWSALGGMASQGVRSMMVPATLASDKTFADVIEKGGTVAEATQAASATYLTTTLSGVLPMATPGKLTFRLGAGAASGQTQGEVNRQIMRAALPDSMQPAAPTTDDYILEALAGAAFGGLAGPRDAATAQRRATEVALRTYTDAAQAEHAKQGADAISKISELATNSDLRKNSPDTFKQLVRDMTDDAGTPELYVDAKRLAEAMDTAGLDAAFLQTNMPEVAEQMREALQSEGLVRVPVEDYATHLAGTPADAALQPHLRVDPEGKTFGEAQKAQQGDTARFQAEAEKVLAEHAKDSTFRASAQEVHDNVLGQLKEVNRFPSDVNKAYAAMTRDFYTTLADRLGVTPKEALDRYPLQIRAEALPGGGAAFDQGAPKGLTVEGYHFSKQARQTLDSYHFGTGLQGSGREMFQGSADKRLTKRLSFYADKGTGINPEAGVGGFAHRVQLEGVYDANADPLRLRRGGQLAFESAVLDHGYKGYIDRLAGTQSAQVIMLGDHILRPEQLGPQTKITEGTKRVPAPEVRQEASHQIAWKVASQALAHLKIAGELHQQMGGYGADTNPSLSLWLNKEASASKVLELGTLLGYALNQDAMMVTSPKAFKGGDEWGTVAVHGVTPETAAKVYDELRAKVLGPDGEPLIQGHTTGGDTMVILAPKDQAEAIAKQAADALGDRHDVSSDALHVAWPEKGENDYGLSGQKTTVRSGTEPPLRTVADRLRGEAAAELARVLEGQGAANDPGRTGFEGTLNQEARGQIQFGKDITQQPSIITLFKGADLTTFLHESGHFFLEVYSDVASRADAPPLIAKDMGVLLDWFGMKAEGDPLASWRAMPVDAKREFHEKFARGFEAYLLEGKAPTPGLQGLFSRFASWLVQAYKSVAGLNVEITPEVRGVMDRMLASEETIRQSEDASGMLPLFTEKPPGMDAEAYARYQALGQSATDGAVADLQHRGARDMKWLSNAQSAALKAEQAKAETARAAIRDEVTLEVDAHPAFQAKAFLDDKANKGADLDFVADQFGYSSGEEMVQAISDVGNRTDVIAAMTDQRMLAEHGDLVDERAVAKAASAAIHNDVRLRFLATELRTLAQATGSARATAQAAKQAAEASVSAKRVRDLRPGQYGAAEARAGKASAEAFKAGDVQTAAVQKRAQILSHALARAAGEAQVEAEKAVKYLKKFEKEGVRKALPADYLVQIDALLDKHDLRQTSMKAADETRTLRTWVQSRLNAGEIPPLSENLLSPKERKAYQDQISIRDENGNLVFADPEEQIKLLADAIESGARTSHIDMTVEGLRGLRDTVRTIEHMGRQAGKILTAEENATYQSVRDEIVASLERNATRSGLGDRTSNTRLGEAVQGIKQFAVSHLRPATWAQIMDGGESNGALWKYLIKPANDRMAHETTRKAQATEALATVLSPILKNVTLRDKAGSGKYFKELGTSLNWQERFAFLLNYGNESNLQRLKDGGIAGVSKALTDAQIQTVLRTMTAAELRAAQAVWDHLETYRPEIAALERKMTGKEPEWIQPRPFSVRSVDGELVHLAGGYYPVVFDPRGSLQAQQHAQAQEAKTLSRAAYSAATTSRSFTKQRVDEVVGRPLLLNLSGLYRGVNDVIHDLSFREWTVDANKLLRSKTIDASIRDHYGPEVKRTMEKWRDDLVAGTRNLDHGVEQASAFARRHVSMAGLSFNVMSAAIQPLGLTQSMARVGVKWTAKGVADYIARRGELTQEVHAQSEFMRNRGSTAFRELAELGAQVKGQTKWGEFRDRYAFWMTAAAQGLVDIPTWRGAHLKALDEGFDDATAVSLADQAVKDSQGGGELVDLSGIERGPAVTKLFTVFYSFMNTALNTGALATVHSSGKADLAIKLALTAVIPTVLGKVFRDAMTPGDSGNYEDWEKTAKTLAAEQVQFLFGLVTFVREFSGVTRTLTGEKDMGYSGPTGLRMIPDAGKLAKQAMQGEFDTAFRKALLNFMGDVFGIPSAQINRTWNGMEALIDGETENPMALISGYQKPQP